MNGKKIQVMLVDDHALIRKGLRAMLEAEDDIEVLCEAESGLDALRLFRQKNPDITILDIALPDYSGLQIATQLIDIARKGQVQSRVIILSMHSKENLVNQALQSGVYGYVLKSSPSLEILEAVRSVYLGRHYCCPRVNSLIIPEYIRQRNRQGEGEAYNLLTPREQEIFRLLVEGRSNVEIAVLLCISDKTVQRHRANLMAKLGVGSYRELLHYGIKIGLFEAVDTVPDEPSQRLSGA
jgi:DNA-binding NarL/FixJ family response regulator